MRPVLCLLLALAPPAVAAAPDVESGALCRDLAWTGTHVSAAILNECTRWEAEARSEVAPAWDGLPVQVRWHCGRMAFLNGTGSTRALAMCVRTAGMPGQGTPHTVP